MGQPSSPRPAQEPGPPRWVLESRGSFLFGRCLVCGFSSPGRRARPSAEDDMLAHTLLCRASETVRPEEVVEAPRSHER